MVLENPTVLARLVSEVLVRDSFFLKRPSKSLAWSLFLVSASVTLSYCLVLVLGALILC